MFRIKYWENVSLKPSLLYFVTIWRTILFCLLYMQPRQMNYAYIWNGSLYLTLVFHFSICFQHGVGLNHRNAKWKISTFCRVKLFMISSPGNESVAQQVQMTNCELVVECSTKEKKKYCFKPLFLRYFLLESKEH